MRKNANQGDVKFYTLLAIVLGVITFFEFAFVEWQGLLFNNDGLILWSLYILSIVKFFLVVMFFMHLWGDHNLLSQLFTAGMVVGSITVALMLMLFTADNMNRYRVEQPVSVAAAHGSGHGGGHGGGHDDKGHVEIPVRDFAETLARPAPKSQQYALAPRESIDAGSLNLPNISLPAIDQGVLPIGNSSMQPEIMQPVAAPITSAVTTQPLAQPLAQTPIQEVQPAETVITETVATETITTEVAPIVPTAPITTTVTPTQTNAITTTTTTTTNEVVTTNAEDTDLATLRAQVEALRVELDSMEDDLPIETATTTTQVVQAVQAPTTPIVTAPTVAVPTVTTPVASATTVTAPITETITTTVTQEVAPVAAATTATVAAGVAGAAAINNISANASTTQTSTQVITTEVVETVDVSFDTELGTATYMNCLACHQATGEGIPGAFPPLKGHITNLYNAEGGREYIVQVVLYGLMGEINVNGTTYNGAMTPWNSLDDDAVAAVLNHELTSWGNDALLNDFRPITAEEVAIQRAMPLTMQDVLENRVIE